MLGFAAVLLPLLALPGSSPQRMEIIKRNQMGFEVLLKRWIAEKTFAWLGINRRMSKAVELFARTSLAFS